jgi:hypothetical protein
MATKFSRRIPSVEEHRKLSQEILHGSDRSVAIILASEVERFLEFAILAKLPNTDDQDKLVGHDGPLDTFSRKIHLGYAMGIYDARFRDDLIRIKDIRNDFAHSVMPLCFTDIGDRCAAIKLMPPTDAPMIILRWGLNQGPVDILGLGDAAEKTARNLFIVACNCASAWLYGVIAKTVHASAL